MICRCAALAVLALLSTGAGFAQSPTVVVTSHSLGGPGVGGFSDEFYIPARTIELTVGMALDGTEPITALRYRLQLPPGFLYTGLGGANPPQVLPLGNSGTLDFLYRTVPAFPASFKISILVPADATGTYTVRGRANFGVSGGAVQLGNEVANQLEEDTVAPVISLTGSSRITVNCQGVVNDPGFIATDNAEGNVTAQVVVSGTVNTSVPGTYTRTYSIVDGSGNAAQPRQRTVVVLNNCPGTGEGEGEGEGPCPDNCATAPLTDSDFDGLTDCEERCITGTLPNLADSDRDGMDDKYEADNSPPLDPTRADDDEDGDGDGISNLEEFLNGTAPGNANDPQVLFFVAAVGGSDGGGDGTLGRPWRTINFAIAQASGAASADAPVRVIVLGGTYSEDVVMAPFVSVIGQPLDAPGGVLQPVLEGTIIGADNTELASLTIEGVADDDILLDASGDVKMRVSNVIFREGGTGILLDGLRPADGVIEGCRFNFLAVGIEIRGAIPTLRRSFFGNLSTSAKQDSATGVHVKETTLPVPPDGSLGDASVPTDGFNQFNINTIEGPAVINDRVQVLKMEGNDWRTNDEGQIAEAIVGPADFVPFLNAGSAILAASLFCTVVDAETQERVTDARIELAPSVFAPVTDNLNGVYAFPALSDGTYQVTTTADGFDASTQTVFVRPGEITGLLVQLGLPLEDGDGGGCNNEEEKVRLSQKAGDLMLTGLALAAMLGAGLFTRRMRA